MLTNPEIRTATIIPAYNEAKTISSVARAAIQAESTDAVIIVDDGSTDRTRYEAHHAATQNTTTKPVLVVEHNHNLGKTEALISGIEQARTLGSISLENLIFLDADSSPIWSRDTADNMKLWQIVVNRIAKSPTDTLNETVLLGREAVFIVLLARYIDEIAQPVIAGSIRMRMGMYERNVVTDTFFTILGQGGHAGNRALKLSDWDNMLQAAKDNGQPIHGWEVEAALNAYLPDHATSSFIMRSVVNVGSRKKAGSTTRGLIRMAKIHSQAIRRTLISRQ